MKILGGRARGRTLGGGRMGHAPHHRRNRPFRPLTKQGFRFLHARMQCMSEIFSNLLEIFPKFLDFLKDFRNVLKISDFLEKFPKFSSKFLK